MPKVTPDAIQPQRQMETRAKNKTTHPGQLVKPSPRRSKADADQAKQAKAQAKADREEAKQRSINRAAIFECADIANEDSVDVTPRLAPKAQMQSHNQTDSPFSSCVDTDVEESDGPDKTPPAPTSVDDDYSAVESDVPTPVGKGKGKQIPPAAKVKGKQMPPAAKVKKLELGNKRRVEDVDMPPGSDEVPQEPKLKKTKLAKKKMRDEIMVATTKILENKELEDGNKYAGMVSHLMVMSGKVLPHSSIQPVGKQLKREGAVSDLMTIVGGRKEKAIADISYPNPNTSTRPQPDNKIR